MVVGEDKTVYGGGRNIIGEIAYDESNHLYFSSLLEDPSIDDIISSISVDDKILFLSENQLQVYNTSDNTIRAYLNDSQLTFQGIFKYHDEYLISTENKGLYKLNESLDEITSYPVFDSLSLKTGIHWISENNDNNNLTALVDDSGNIYLESDQEVEELTFDD